MPNIRSKCQKKMGDFNSHEVGSELGGTKRKEKRKKEEEENGPG